MRGESRFSASGTAKEIESAFRGNGTDERLIIDILSTLDNDQRQDLADEYIRRYDEVRVLSEILHSRDTFCHFNYILRRPLRIFYGGDSNIQGNPSSQLKPPVDLDFGCSATLPGQ